MKSKKTIKIIISITATIFIACHLIFPNLNIDLITVILFCLILIPWVEPLFKSVELPGGVKLEFQELEKIEKEAKEVGLIDEQQINVATSKNYDFIEIANTNQALALVGLRIEIEKKLREIANKYNLETQRLSVSQIIRLLSDKNILTIQESNVLRDILSTLNQASHGVEYDGRTGDWIIEVGPELIESLHNKVVNRGHIFQTEDKKVKHWIDESFEKYEGNTNLEHFEHINKHKELWEKELDNIYSSLLQKVNTSQRKKLERNQEEWLSYCENYLELFQSFDDLQMNVGREGQIFLSIHLMEKVKERVLELEDILNNLV
ncbi:hypothetical protein BEI02_03325 [Elizabethkingia sp. HvH-WGS333]|uniref:lysozyme inhibitor LprI family protein n=1 Tax=Elizabethkingia TaxID=308865 RepID=UPI0007415245|nr:MULTISPECIES: lysozyme inhibitor LprI family protein [Elizabethkingia]KUG13794.1 hypothetical protein AMC91_00650 [Elizabethkingia miricola]MCL1658351.1 DUF1311 domain-containing protein [Elizabethkingia miricola]OIK46071.1 hypothetical protein BEI02_03325 [Elizabethkingia sp. HvH-WGS333]